MTAEERGWYDAVEEACRKRDWEVAFRNLQRLLASVRSRRDDDAIHPVLDRFATVLAECGDVAAAARIRDYSAGKFR